MEKQLPPKQLLAAQLLADGLPFKLVSEQVGVSLSVVYKWKHIPAFNAYVNELLKQNENKAFQDNVSYSFINKYLFFQTIAGSVWGSAVSRCSEGFFS